jgi:hypothetical protein
METDLISQRNAKLELQKMRDPGYSLADILFYFQIIPTRISENFQAIKR